MNYQTTGGREREATNSALHECHRSWQQLLAFPKSHQQNERGSRHEVRHANGGADSNNTESWNSRR